MYEARQRAYDPVRLVYQKIHLCIAHAILRLLNSGGCQLVTPLPLLQVPYESNSLEKLCYETVNGPVEASVRALLLELLLRRCSLSNKTLKSLLRSLEGCLSCSFPPTRIADCTIAYRMLSFSPTGCWQPRAIVQLQNTTCASIMDLSRLQIALVFACRRFFEGGQ